MKISSSKIVETKQLSYVPPLYKKSFKNLDIGPEVPSWIRQKYSFELGQNGTFNAAIYTHGHKLEKFVLQKMPKAKTFEHFLNDLRQFAHSEGLPTNRLAEKDSLTNISFAWEKYQASKDTVWFHIMTQNALESVFEVAAGILEALDYPLPNNTNAYIRKYYTFMDSTGKQVTMPEPGKHFLVESAFPVFAYNYPEHFFGGGHLVSFTSPHFLMNGIQDSLLGQIALNSYHPNSGNQYAVPETELQNYTEKYWGYIAQRQFDLYSKLIQGIQTPLDFLLMKEFSGSFTLEAYPKYKVENIRESLDQLKNYFEPFSRFGRFGLQLGAWYLKSTSNYANSQKAIENWKLYAGSNLLVCNQILQEVLPKVSSLKLIVHSIEKDLNEAIPENRQKVLIQANKNYRAKIMTAFRLDGANSLYSPTDREALKTLLQASGIQVPATV